MLWYHSVFYNVKNGVGKFSSYINEVSLNFLFAVYKRIII